MPILPGILLEGERAKVLRMCAFAATMVNNILTKGACWGEQSIINRMGILSGLQDRAAELELRVFFRIFDMIYIQGHQR